MTSLIHYEPKNVVLTEGEKRDMEWLREQHTLQYGWEQTAACFDTMVFCAGINHLAKQRRRSTGN